MRKHALPTRCCMPDHQSAWLPCSQDSLIVVVLWNVLKRHILMHKRTASPTGQVVGKHIGRCPFGAFHSVIIRKLTYPFAECFNTCNMYAPSHAFPMRQIPPGEGACFWTKSALSNHSIECYSWSLTILYATIGKSKNDLYF